MLFNSLEFAVFFAICFGLYLVLPHRAQNRMLLVASYVFYGAWDWRFLGLILTSTIIDYAVGLRLGAATDPRRRRQLVTISIIANLALLGTFKYAGFFADSLVVLASRFGVELSPFTLQLVLPVGISFYTFQTLSYTIDIYREQMQPTRRFLDFALFVAFFPQLVAGPIERARRICIIGVAFASSAVSPLEGRRRRRRARWNGTSGRVHAASCTLAVISQTGRRLKDFRVETNGQALVGAVRMIPGHKHLVFEEGFQSAWLYETLRVANLDKIVFKGGLRPIT
jgi:hypothetical protein